MLYDSLDGWYGVGGVQDGGDIYIYIHIYLWLIPVDVWHKPTQYCKIIILQLKIKKNFLKKERHMHKKKKKKGKIEWHVLPF